MDRRAFVLGVLAAATAMSVHAQALPPAGVTTPEQIVRWIYAEAVKKDKEGSQRGGTIFNNDKPSRLLFSRAFMREWDASQARIKKSGDMGLDFDPVSNSQDPSIGKTDIRVESSTTVKATVAAIFGSLEQPKEKPQTVRYDFIREGDTWKIDDIRGAVERDGWSLRKLMKEWK